MNNTVNIIGRIDQKIAATIGTNKFTEQLTQNLDKYAGINVDDKQPHEICKLRFVLADNITRKTNCKESMNLYSTKVKRTMNLVNGLDLDNIATDLPKMLKDLDAKMKLQGQYFIVAHLPYDESKNIKAGGRMMWIKFLDTEDKPELFTIYNNVQSQNHKITLGQSEKYSLKEDGEYISEKSEKAATKLQAFRRGKNVRDDAKKVKQEKEASEKRQAVGQEIIEKHKAKEKEEQKNAALEEKRKEYGETQLKIREDIKAKNERKLREFNETQQQQQNLADENATKLKDSNLNAVAAAVRQQAVQQQAVQQQAEQRRLEQQAEQRRQQYEDITETQNVKKLTTKADTLHTLQLLKNKLPPRGFLQRGLHMGQETHNQDKKELIIAVNNEIINYNKEFPESPIKQIDYEDKNINEINRADIIAQISDKINQINGKKGGKSTRRRRRKMNPTRKRGRRKPKTKKKSNKGVINKRKTRSKK
jgi:hypothetical protein